MHYYAYGSSRYYNKELSDISIELEEHLTEFNSIVCGCLESDGVLDMRGANNYHEDCLEPLMSHLEKHGGLMNSLSDPLTMLLLVNCLTYFNFHCVSYDLNAGHTLPTATPEVNHAAECLSDFKARIGNLVTVMTRVQLLYRNQ